MNSRTAGWALAAVTVLQPLAGALAPAFGIGIPTGERATEGGIPPELPPGIFFAIWSVIFLGFGVCAAIVLMQRERPQGWAWPLALAGTGNIIWMLQNQLIGLKALDFLIIVGILPFAATALKRALVEAAPGSPSIPAIVSGLLTGWLSVATAISLPPFARTLLSHGPTDAVWGYATLTVVIALTLVLLVRARAGWSLACLASVAWGLTGLVLNNFERTELRMIGWLFAAALAFVAILALRTLLARPKQAP